MFKAAACKTHVESTETIIYPSHMLYMIMSYATFGLLEAIFGKLLACRLVQIWGKCNHSVLGHWGLIIWGLPQGT